MPKFSCSLYAELLLQEEGTFLKHLVKQAGFLIPSVMLAILFFVLAFAGSIYIGTRVIDNYRADMLVRECDVLDSALLMYAKAHRQVDPENVEIRTQQDGNSYMYYTTGRIFPRNLSDLGTIRDEQGYFSEAIDLSKFTYTTQTDADGNMTYTLGVTMPNGEYYLSPLSKK